MVETRIIHYIFKIVSYALTSSDMMSTKLVKEISDWIQIGIECLIPHRKYQMKPHSLPWFTQSCADAIAHRNHYFHQFHWNKTRENKKLFMVVRNYCKRVLEEAKSNCADATRHYCLTVLDYKIFGENLTVFLTEVTLQANLLARRFSANSTLDDTLHSLADFPSRMEQKIFSMRITVRMVANAICELNVAKATGPDCIPSIVFKDVFSRVVSCSC